MEETACSHNQFINKFKCYNQGNNHIVDADELCKMKCTELEFGELDFHNVSSQFSDIRWLSKLDLGRDIKISKMMLMKQ